MQPAVYESFQCIAEACEDTCCEGWGISVDKATFEKYQGQPDGDLGVKLQQLVRIQNPNNDLAYASIQLTDGRCPFFEDSLCSIQKQLGKDYLGHACASYPRILNTFDGQPERSLDLSCPEAARLVLLDRRPLQFSRGFAGCGSAAGVRKLVLEILRDRRHAVAERLRLVGWICGQWSEFEAAPVPEEARVRFLENWARSPRGHFHAPGPRLAAANPASQLAIVLDLLAARIHLDYSSARALALYREFVEGLQLAPGCAWDSSVERYLRAYHSYYAPFMQQHEHMLEHYLVAYAFTAMFPFGRPPVNRGLDLGESASLFTAQYLLMASYFFISKAVLIGLAGKYQSGFGAEHVVRTIQTIARSMEHCEKYPARLLAILAEKGIKEATGMDMLIEN